MSGDEEVRVFTEELGYGFTHEVEALEIEVGLLAMRSKKYACWASRTVSKAWC